MKVLVIGGSSSVGKVIKEQLAAPYEIITAGRKDCDVFMDLNDPLERLNFPDNIDVVVHTAASFGGKAGDEMRDALNVNVIGTLKLLQASAASGVKHFIMLSSMFALLEKNSPFYSVYSLSKRHAEEVAELFAVTNDLALTILRPSQIYGSNDTFRVHQPFFYMIMDKVANGEDVTIYGSNDPKRNYIHINDLINIIRNVIQKKVTGVFMCMNTTDVSYSQIAEVAIKVANSKSKVIFLTDKENIPDNVFANDTTLYEKTGYFPQVSINDGVKDLIKQKNLIR